MKIKKANKKLKKLVTAAIKESNHNKIDIIVRKIDILKEFIIFKTEENGW